MGNNCFACLKSSEGTNNATTTTLNNQHVPVSEKISQESRLETEELLHTTNLQNNRTNHYDSNNYKKSLMVLNGSANSNSSLIDDKQTIQSAKESQLADNAINKLFEVYKDKNEDAILSEGVEKLCQDLNYSPDEFAILVLAFCLNAQTMCCFTKQEFIHGLKKLNATTINELKLRLIQIVDKLQTDMDLFKQLYRYTFHFGLDEGARILSVDMATSLWKLLYSIHKPPENVLERWFNFLAKENIRGIQRDTWMMFQNFAENFDINSYDSDEAWPSLFDDFVEYEKMELDRFKKLEQQNADQQDSCINNNNIYFNDNEQINNYNLHVN